MTESLEARISVLERKLSLLEDYSVEAFWISLDRAYEAILRQRELSCIVCGRSAPRTGFSVLFDKCIFGGGLLERYQCCDCDAVFGPQKCLDLTDDFVGRDYALLYTRYNEANSTENEIRTFRSLNPNKSGVYLNWGCGAWSETVDRLRAEGFEVWGFEPSAEVSSPYVVKTRAEISALFDGIFSNNVVEHFRKPRLQFDDFRHMLKPGGLMAHSSPCYEYAYAFTRFHTLFLLGRSADILAKQTGFRVKSRTQDGEYINLVFEAVGTSSPGSCATP